MKKQCIYLGLFLFTVSCTTGNLKIESQPEGADVYIAINGQTSKKIGVTPLSVPESQINSGSESYQISIAKDGFAPEHILAPATTFASAANIQVKLKEQINSKQAVNDEVLQKLSSQIAYSIELIMNKEYDSAERNLLNLQTQFPNVSTIHELLGNVFYLKKDLSKAHAYYRRASMLNPNNIDTTRMIQKIEGIRSDLRSETRSPSSTGGY